MKSQPSESLVEHKDVLGLLEAFVTFVVLDITKLSGSVRDIIIRNFLARGLTLLQSILLLYEREDSDSGWILHRALIERLATLLALAQNDDFDVFEEWSFVNQFEGRRAVRDDQELGQRFRPYSLEDTPEERERYLHLKTKDVLWKPPRVKDIMTGRYRILYRLGYDYGSRAMHSRAHDGTHDVHRLVRDAGLPQLSVFRDEVLLYNSFLVFALLLWEAIGATTLTWDKTVGAFLFTLTQVVGTRTPYDERRAALHGAWAAVVVAHGGQGLATVTPATKPPET
jgi:hypothetical protein